MANSLSEANIKRTCTEYLALDGWRFIDTDPPGLRGLGVREKGIADRLYIRYEAERPGDALAEVLWIEWKKRGGKAMAHQTEWIAAERARGALVLLAGVDFPASIEGFQCWYRASGLTRREI